MTTLAEMTPEQRDNCRGMWHEITWTGTGKVDLGVLLYLGICSYHGDEVGYLWVPSIVDGDVYPLTGEMSLNALTPRPDLPRAWQADGTPVKGRWDYESNRIIDHGGRTVRTIDSRRFVGEWEGEWEEE